MSTEGEAGASGAAAAEPGASGAAAAEPAASGAAAEGAEAVFDWAVSHGYKLLSLERKRYSLEDIFIRLTTQEPTGEERQS
jgi:hypothetical protein